MTPNVLKQLDGSHLAAFPPPFQTQPDTVLQTLETLIRTCQGHFVKSVLDVGPLANNNNVMSNAASNQRHLQGQYNKYHITFSMFINQYPHATLTALYAPPITVGQLQEMYPSTHIHTINISSKAKVITYIYDYHF